MVEPDGLLRAALAHLPWDDRMRARRTASTGVAYNYSGISYPNVPLPPFLQQVCLDIEEVVGHKVTNCLANYYPTGTSRMGFHSDSADGIVEGTTTSIISLGDARALTFRLKANREYRVERLLEAGSLLVMEHDLQDEWQHGLLPNEAAGPRMSLTFRHIVDESKVGLLE